MQIRTVIVALIIAFAGTVRAVAAAATAIYFQIRSHALHQNDNSYERTVRLVFGALLAVAMFLAFPSFAHAEFAVSSALITFPTQAAGTTSPAQTITFTNNRVAPAFAQLGILFGPDSASFVADFGRR